MLLIVPYTGTVHTGDNMRILLIAAAFSAAVLVLASPAAAGPGFMQFSFNTSISGFKRPQDLTQACLVASVAAGAAGRAEAVATVEWCARAAAHLFSLYPRDNPPPAEE